jgi:glycerol uptake facilitator-like aquaporin
MSAAWPQRLVAETLGTALLLAVVVGSGIMGERLAGGNTAIALLANAIATGTALYALITTLGPISGAHFNPLVTIIERAEGKLCTKLMLGYLTCQFVGAIAGVLAAHAMFELPVLSTSWLPSQHVRTGISQWWSEVVATFGLITVILYCVKNKSDAVPAVVATYITAAYWFTASTSFANPAVTVARSLTDTFSGIRPLDVPGFIGAQMVGAALAYLLYRWIFKLQT